MTLASGFSLAILLCAVCSSAQAPPQTPVSRPCREHPQLVAPCFTVRGRMEYFNGAPSVRIWKVGTRRILGVSEGRFALPGYENLPTSIESQLTKDENALFADFSVCPFTRDEPGVMQLVCVDSATNEIVRRRR